MATAPRRLLSEPACPGTTETKRPPKSTGRRTSPLSPESAQSAGDAEGDEGRLEDRFGRPADAADEELKQHLDHLLLTLESSDIELVRGGGAEQESPRRPRVATSEAPSPAQRVVLWS